MHRNAMSRFKRLQCFRSFGSSMLAPVAIVLCAIAPALAQTPVQPVATVPADSVPATSLNLSRTEAAALAEQHSVTVGGAQARIDAAQAPL
jgi:hypothetical protein